MKDGHAEFNNVVDATSSFLKAVYPHGKKLVEAVKKKKPTKKPDAIKADATKKAVKKKTSKAKPTVSVPPIVEAKK